MPLPPAPPPLAQIKQSCSRKQKQAVKLEFQDALKEIKWDIIGLPEVRRKEEELINRHSGNYFYYNMRLNFNYFGETKG